MNPYFNFKLGPESRREEVNGQIWLILKKRERENEEESEEKENLEGELNMVLVLRSLSETKEESREEEESIRRSDHEEVTAKARFPNFTTMPSSKSHTSIKDIRRM